MLGGGGGWGRESERVMNRAKVANSSTVLAASRNPVSFTEAPPDCMLLYPSGMNVRQSSGQRNGS